MRDDTVDQIRERTDIVELIGQYVGLQKAGRNFKGLCPFHQEKTPSFIVFPESQNFHCFGCGAGGDAFSFLMQVEKTGFREALETLAERAGIELKHAPPPSPELSEQHQRLFALNAQAASWFAHVLWNTRTGEPARELLERRGVDKTTAERFQLGYAPERGDALLDYFQKRQVKPDDLVEAGLARRRDDDSLSSYFWNRLIFPIRDREGRIAGFGGRILGNGQPKYLNSAQNAIFDKSSNLYALDLAEEAIRRERQVIVVEGYMDAITAHQFGFTNVVASMGTALTEAQARLLRRGIDRILLALDADAAGQMATLRGLDVMRDSFTDADRPVVDVGDRFQTVIRFQRTLKRDIRIVRIPSGKDPDELIRRDVDAWKSAIEHPVPLLDFYIEAVIGEAAPAEPEAKSEMAQRLEPVLSEIEDPIVRDHYIRLTAQRLGVSESVLRSQVERRPATTRRGRPSAPPPRQPSRSPSQLPVADPEMHLMSLVLKHLLHVYDLLAEIPGEAITDPRDRAILDLLRATPLNEWTAVAQEPPEELRPRFEQLQLVPENDPFTNPGQVRREYERAINRLREARLNEEIRQLQAQVAEATREQDSQGLRETLALLNQAMERMRHLYPAESPYFKDLRSSG